VYCPIEALHTSLAVARDACAGRFTHAGTTLDVGWPPRWLASDVHSDREWWIEWIKFYVGLDLAYAYSQTHDVTFPRAWQRLVDSWIQTVPLGTGPTDAVGRRLQNWVYAWNRFADGPADPGFDPAFGDALTVSIAEQADYLETHLTRERNHRTLELYALFVVALALPETDPAERRLERTWRALHQNLLADVLPDGVHRELSTHYHMVVLRSFLAARENARRFGLPAPSTYDDRLHRAVDFAVACHRPDGTIPALSDSDTGTYRDTLALAADLLDRPDARFVATGGREGAAPRSRIHSFPLGGYYVQTIAAVGYESRGRHLILDAGPVGDGGHGHYDALSLEAWAGRPLVVDPGRFTYAEGTPNWRRWFKGSAAHNTVVIDGRDQTAYFSGKPKRPQASARLVTELSVAGVDVLGAEVRSAEYDAVHVRHVFFVDGDYWIVLDELTAQERHDYDLRFHFAPDAWCRTTVAQRSVHAPGVVLLMAGSGELTLETGWVSPAYGVKHPAPVVSLRTPGATRARFVTAIVPTSAHTAFGRARLAVRDAGTDGTEILVQGLGPDEANVDRLIWRDQSADGVNSHGLDLPVVWTRRQCPARIESEDRR